VQVDESVFGGQSLKLVRSGHEWETSLSLQGCCNFFSESFVGVESSADGCATLGKLVDVLEALLNAHVAIAELVNVTRELLTKSQRSGILSVSSSNLDDIIEFSALGIKNIS